MSLKLLTLLLSVLATSVSSSDDEVKLWAVLVAGSVGFFDYRHQANVCHAYQVLHKHGIPDERIIVMMRDDIADHVLNKHPGTVMNRLNGPDVYHGVPKDYVLHSVSPDVFLNVLLGNSEKVKGKGSGKVLKSGPNDHVFIYFTDHGGPGLVKFPEAVVIL